MVERKVSDIEIGTKIFLIYIVTKENKDLMLHFKKETGVMPIDKDNEIEDWFIDWLESSNLELN